jgi:hypothetical protein
LESSDVVIGNPNVSRTIGQNGLRSAMNIKVGTLEYKQAECTDTSFWKWSPRKIIISHGYQTPAACTKLSKLAQELGFGKDI